MTRGVILDRNGIPFELARAAGFVDRGVNVDASTVNADAVVALVGALVTVTVVIVDDVTGAPLEGVVVSIAVSGTGNTINQPSAVTDSEGVATATFSSTTVEAKTISATGNGLALVDTAAVSIVASTFGANIAGVPNLLCDVGFTQAAGQPDGITESVRGSSSNFPDPTDPSGDGKVANFIYAAGAASGFGVGQRRDVTPAGTVRLGIAFTMKLPANITPHPSNDKAVYAFRTPGQEQGSWVFGFQPNGSGGLRYNVQCQVSGQATLFANENAFVLPLAQWEEIEIDASMNTAPGAADGILRVWRNGLRIFNYTSVIFTGVGGNMQWQNIALDPYYGGETPGWTIPETFEIRFARWRAKYSSIRGTP